MPTKGYIYLIRNLVNGKAYIGKTEKTVAWRFSRHKFKAKRGSTYALHAAMRKYGVHNFSVIEIASCEPYQLNDLEKHFISAYETFAPAGKGYNLTLGGEGQSGLVHSKETKAKLSASTKAYLATNGHPFEGKRHTDESIRKMRIAQHNKIGPNKGKIFGPHSEDHKKKIGEGNRGKVFSIERRARISAGLKGRPYSEETKRRLSESHMGHVASDETKAKMSAAQKARWAIRKEA